MAKVCVVTMVLLLLSGCATPQGRLVWRVREMALVQTPMIGLQGRDQAMLVTLNTRTVQRLLLAHIRITRTAGLPAELVIVEGKEPNAFAGLTSGRRVIGINTEMVKVIGDDIDEFAALVGHEAAHWAKGHVDSGRAREGTLHAIGTLVKVGLGAAGVPAAGTITGLGVDLINASYSRDQEREADESSVVYLLSNGYDPHAAIRLHEKLLKVSGKSLLPFFSSHPSGQERIENLKALIQAKKSESGSTPPSHDGSAKETGVKQ
jgi:predicted Zn-dependent protease